MKPHNRTHRLPRQGRSEVVSPAKCPRMMQPLPYETFEAGKLAAGWRRGKNLKFEI